MFKRKLRGEKLIQSLPYGEYFIRGKRVKIGLDKNGDMRIDSVPSSMRNYSWFSDYDGYWYAKEDFERYVGMKARRITERHITRIETRKDETMNCHVRQGDTIWLCPHCLTLTTVKPSPQCCCGTMTVRFHAPEPTGTALLDELKPNTAVKINGVLCLVGVDEDGDKTITPATNTDLYTYKDKGEWCDVFELSKGIGFPVEFLTSAYIKQIPTEAK